MESLQKFHDFTFSQVLRLVKYPMLFSPEEADNAVLVLPLRAADPQSGADPVVDWDFVRRIAAHDPKVAGCPSTDSERAGFVFKDEEYKDAVVMPWYR